MSAPIWDIVAGHDGTISDGAPWQAVKALALMRRKPIISRALGGLVILAMAGFCLSASARAQSRHADTELEALLPTTLGGVALTIESQAGSELATNNAAFDSFLAPIRADNSRPRSEPGASKTPIPCCCSRSFRRQYRLPAQYY